MIIPNIVKLLRSLFAIKVVTAILTLSTISMIRFSIFDFRFSIGDYSIGDWGLGIGDWGLFDLRFEIWDLGLGMGIIGVNLIFKPIINLACSLV